MTDEQIFGGRYQIEAPIGDGGMARVFRAFDARLDRTVALKVLREQFTHEQEFIDRFRQEARLAAGLAHPAIVGVYDVGIDHDRHYIVMEYVEGENLKALIAREAPMPVEAVIPLLRQLAAALDYAHDRGVIHRDIKPENILVTPRREVKVGDFGIARALASAGLTATGTVLGSVSYFSPEQASGQPATAESDLYSAGVVLYEMLTRQVPFAGPNPVAVAMAQVNDPPPPPRLFLPDFSPAVEAVVLRAIAKNPANRFHSGYELITALGAPAPLRAGRQRAAAVAMTPTLPNAPVSAAVPSRPRQGTGGAFAALVTTTALLIAAVLVGRTLTSGNSAAEATPTFTPGLAGITPQAGSDAVAPGPVSTATPPPRATAHAVAPSATTGPAAHAAPSTTSVAPAPSATQPPPSATPVSTATTVVAVPSATAPAASATLPAAASTVAGATATPAAATQTPEATGSTGGATVTLTMARDVDGQYNPVGPTTVFSTKSPNIFAVTRIFHKPKGAIVRFRWTYPSGQVFDYTDTYVSRDRGDIPAYGEINPQGPGSYSVEVLVNGHPLAHADFTVVVASPTAGSSGHTDHKHGNGGGNGD